jgi:hypothetical protein
MSSSRSFQPTQKMTRFRIGRSRGRIHSCMIGCSREGVSPLPFGNDRKLGDGAVAKCEGEKPILQVTLIGMHGRDYWDSAAQRLDEQRTPYSCSVCSESPNLRLAWNEGGQCGDGRETADGSSSIVSSHVDFLVPFLSSLPLNATEAPFPRHA